MGVEPRPTPKGKGGEKKGVKKSAGILSAHPQRRGGQPNVFDKREEGGERGRKLVGDERGGKRQPGRMMW